MICGGLLGLLLPYEPRGRSSIWFGWWVVHPEMGCGVLCSFKIETRSWGWMCIWFFFSVQCTSDWNYNQWVVEAEPDILDYNGTTGSVTASRRRYSILPWILSVGPPVTSIFLGLWKGSYPIRYSSSQIYFSVSRFSVPYLDCILTSLSTGVLILVANFSNIEHSECRPLFLLIFFP